MIHKKPRLIGYARVSTEDQNPQLQIDALSAAGVADNHIHIEKVSGASRRRPILDKAIKDCRRGDTLVVWKLDRFARSMPDLYKRLEVIERKGVQFKSLTEGFDLTNATGRLIVGIFGVIAEFERQLTRERTKAGMAAARAAGRGRPIKMTENRIAKARKLRKSGMTWRAIASHFEATEDIKITYQGVRRAVMDATD